jgi:hypothetical protein
LVIDYWFLALTVGFYLGITGLAPLASNSFATAQKSNQKSRHNSYAP